MQKALDWAKTNIDTVIVLTGASVVMLLDLADVAPPEMIENAILFTLAGFAFTLLRERWRRDNAGKQLTDDIATVKTKIAKVETAIDQVNKMVSDLSAVRVLTGKAVDAALHEARQDTSIWIFKGGTGTFIRQVTLPDCVQNARRRRRSCGCTSRFSTLPTSRSASGM